ncbi:MAG: sulfatase-like hydrolase/transferase [Candidatus Micrarchaeota archaeon]|nr:sulfatase-like hydrolase/transferase [Candidatus Micrarchaeota archaeon]
MKKPNVVIILMDTMRRDEFARLEWRHGSLHDLGFLFLDNCIAPSSWTLPSHASLFTGLYPSKHGAHETKTVKSLDIDNIRLKLPTFVKDLSRMGYKSHGISANPYVHPIYGFSDFDVFEEESYFTDIFGSVIEVADHLKPRIAKYRNVEGSNLIKLSRNMLMNDPNLFFEAVGSAARRSPGAAFKKLRAKMIEGWPIEKGGMNTVRRVKEIDFEDQYLLFINLMEAHDPYIGKKGMDFNWSTPFKKEAPGESLVAHWKRLYSTASERAYKYTVEIVRSMMYDNGGEQLFVVTSDHGQAFNEHGFIGHGTVLYDEVLRIPMAIKMPYSGYAMPSGKGYCSLINVKKFVLDAIKHSRSALKNFENRSVAAESFGIPANITITDDVDENKIKALERYEIRKFT